MERRDALNQLKRGYREVLILRYVNEPSVQEAAFEQGRVRYQTNPTKWSFSAVDSIVIPCNKCIIAVDVNEQEEVFS